MCCFFRVVNTLACFSVVFFSLYKNVKNMCYNLSGQTFSLIAIGGLTNVKVTFLRSAISSTSCVRERIIFHLAGNHFTGIFGIVPGLHVWKLCSCVPDCHVDCDMYAPHEA